MVTGIHSYTVTFALFDNNVAEISVIRNEMRSGYGGRNMFFVKEFYKVGNIDEMFEILKEKCKEFKVSGFEFTVCCSGISSSQKISEQDTPQKAFERFVVDFKESYPRKKIKFVRYDVTIVY